MNEYQIAYQNWLNTLRGKEFKRYMRYCERGGRYRMLALIFNFDILGLTNDDLVCACEQLRAIKFGYAERNWENPNE